MQTGENITPSDFGEIAAWAVGFFKNADNAERPGLFDLDSRHGYVRLGETKLDEAVSFGFSKIRGLMNPKGDLQAVLSGARDHLVLTVSGCASLEPVVQSTPTYALGA
jgi:hypothetical protein